MKNKLLVIIKLLITCSLLYFVISTVDLATILTLLEKTNIGLFILAIILVALGNFLAAWRWQILLDRHDHHFPISKLSRFYFIGLFFNVFMPTAIGGDVSRWYYLNKSGVKHNQVISSIIYERFLGVCALLIFALGVFSISLNIAEIKLIKIFISAMVFGAIMAIIIMLSKLNIELLIPKKIRPKFKSLFNIYKNFQLYTRNKETILSALAVSMLFQFVLIISMFLLAKAVGDNTSFIYFTTLIPLIWLISIVPISIGGIGLREGSFVILFTTIGMGDKVAVAISLLILLQTLLLGAIGGIFYIYTGSKNKTAIDS